MRIAVAEIAPQGGLLHHAFELADSLAARGHDVDLIVPRENELSGRPGAARRLELLPAPVSAAPASRMGVGWARRKGASATRSLRAWYRLLGAVRAGRYDVFLSGSDIGLSLNAAAYLAATAMPGRPAIAFIHHNIRPLSRLRSDRIYANSPLLMGLLRRALARFELVFVHGETSREELLERWPVRRAVSIPLPDARLFGSEPPAPSPEERILFFGYWNRAKGLPLLMEAFDRVSARRPQARLTIAGAPSPAELDPEQVRGWAARLGERVTLIDHYVPVEQVPELFSRARVVAAPYLAGGYQSAVVRLAMTMGRPVVASEIGELPEMVINGATGRTVPPGDAQALAEALEAVAGDPELAALLGAAAHKRVLDDASWEQVAERVETELRAAVATREPR